MRASPKLLPPAPPVTAKVEEIGTDELAPAGRNAVNELLAELQTAVPGERGQLEVLVRETVETLVYGD